MTNVNIPPPAVTHDQTGNRNDFIPQSPPPVPPGRYLHFDDQGNLQSMENFDGNGRHSQETIGRDGSRYFVTDTKRGTEFDLFGPRDPVTESDRMTASRSMDLTRKYPQSPRRIRKPGRRPPSLTTTMER